MREVGELEGLCPIEEVREIEVDDVVSSENVRIYLLDKLTPTLVEEKRRVIKKIEGGGGGGEGRGAPEDRGG